MAWKRSGVQFPSAPRTNPRSEHLGLFRFPAQGRAVEDFAAEVAAAEGGNLLPGHEATKIMGEILTKLD